MVVQNTTSTAFVESPSSPHQTASLDSEALVDEVLEIAPTSVDEESILHALLDTPHSRMVGGTEYSWCRAVSGGTGITILALLFSKPPDSSILQQAIDRLLWHHPRLRSRLVWVRGRPAFSVSTEPKVKLEILDCTDSSVVFSKPLVGIEKHVANLSCEDQDEVDSVDYSEAGGNPIAEETRKERDWLNIVEVELNTNNWPEQYHCLDPVPLFVVRLYQLSGGRALLVFRLHTAICDRASAATILTETLSFLYELKHGHPPLKERGNLGDYPGKCVEAEAGNGKKVLSSCDTNREANSFVAVEDTIPKGKASKPFWAHGVDILGYSLGSRRHAVLPFKETSKSRHSEIVRLSLSVEHTQELMQMCDKQRTNRFGALSAAGLKATAKVKQLGNRNEHYALIALIDCRSHLDPVLSSSTVGFYHSAILNTHSLNESVCFWDLARKCSTALENSLKNRKHFTDMGDVNFLMCQAIQFPHLTPAASLRTSLMVLFEEPILDDMEDLKKAVDLEDYVGCSSVHGVGPCIAFFDTIQHGSLQSTCVYPAPLYSHSQMHTLLRTMINILTAALQD